MPKNFKYRVTLDALTDKNGEPCNDSVAVEFENHDDIFHILRMMEESPLLPDKEQTKQFIIGLKLVGKVVMDNRDNELFSDFAGAFRDLMVKIKS
ncbi:MAG: DUF3861 domain-containing protein [Rikenellaceae bacterium]|nr:DUF3861 domain-containing protein [Rikenellaceae bacterium]